MDAAGAGEAGRHAHAETEPGAAGGGRLGERCLEGPGVLLREAPIGHALRAAPDRCARTGLDATHVAAPRLWRRGVRGRGAPQVTRVAVQRVRAVA
jgi:hypothetical protein